MHNRSKYNEGLLEFVDGNMVGIRLSGNRVIYASSLTGHCSFLSLAERQLIPKLKNSRQDDTFEKQENVAPFTILLSFSISRGI